MSIITYQGVTLKVVKVHRLEQKTVYTPDEADYLYTHSVLAARCVFNPQATASNAAIAAQSMPVLRQALMSPRGALQLIVGGQVVLNSPAQLAAGQATVDANNGPHPISCDVYEIHGGKTMIVDFVIETWLVDTGQAQAGCLIGHRWEATHDVDFQFMTTRTVNGVAFFRSDLLNSTKLTPDHFRSFLNHPIAKNFKRDKIQVRAGSDGVTLYYSYVDQEQWLNLGIDSPICRIEGEYETAIVGNGFFNPDGAVAVIRRDWMGAINSVINALPMFQAALRITAWGQRSSLTDDLVNACVYVAALYRFRSDQVAFWKDEHITTSLMQKKATYNATITCNGGIAAGLKAMGKLPGYNFGGNAAIPADLGQVASNVLNQENPRPPGNQQGTRGQYIAGLVAQVLTTPGSTPAVAKVGVAIPDALPNGQQFPG